MSAESMPENVVELLNQSGQDTVLEALGIVVTEASKQRLSARLRIGPMHRQPAGYLHGGVSVVLAETVASLASLMNIDPETHMAFGLEINANHLRPKRDGELIAVATPLHLGRTSHVWDVRITDERQKLICISRCTVAVVKRESDAKRIQIEPTDEA